MYFFLLACFWPESIWSGIPESNWRLNLGKVAYYHYTNPATSNVVGTFSAYFTTVSRDPEKQ